MALTLTTFEAKVLRGMREEHLEVRRIWRVYPPYDLGDPSEVLFEDMERKAGTVYVDAQGKVIHGPFAGFGV